MNLLLRIECSQAERRETFEERGGCAGSFVTAYSFRITDGGGLVVSEHWEDSDESYGNGQDIEVPPRIWREAFAWLQKHMQQA